MTTENPTRPQGRLMLTIAWVIALGGLTWFFQIREDKQFNPNAQLSTSGPQELTLVSNRQHHYVATGAINGKAVTFLLDTGASDVVIPGRLAQTHNLASGAPGIAQTANGMVKVYSTRLDHVQLGPINLYQVPASINPSMDDNTVLLGMSALHQLELVQKDGQLTLRTH